MVRKWTYINNEPQNKQPHNLKTNKYFFKKYAYKVFRKTTRFKKVNFFPTFTRRKHYLKRKQKNNNLNRMVVMGVWVKNYLKIKQHVRYYEVLNLSPYKYHTNTADYVQQVNNYLTTLPNITVYSIARNVKNFYNNSKKFKYYKFNWSGMVTDSSQFIDNDEHYQPGYLQYKNLILPYGHVKETFKISNYNPLFQKHSINYVIIFYKILIKLTLYRI